MPSVLTDLSVKGAKPRKGEGDQLLRNEVPDGGLPGFYLIVQPSGKKSWAVRYRYQRQARKFTIGPYPRDHSGRSAGEGQEGTGLGLGGWRSGW